MTKIYITTLAVLLFSLPMFAQEQAKTLFNQMPDSLCQILTKVNRADCIDFLESNMRAVVTNRFNTKSEMTALSADYIRIKLTEKSSWQMKVLSVNDSTQVICTVDTYAAPAKDSQIRFYDTSWKKLDAGTYLQGIPVSTDAFVDAEKAAGSTEFPALYKHIDMLLMEAELNAEDTTLKLQFTTPDYIEKETAEKLEPFLRRTKIFRWSEGRFMPDIEQ